MLAAGFAQFTIGNVFTIVVVVALGLGGYYRLRGVKNETLENAAAFWKGQAEALTATIDEQRTRISEVERERDDQRAAKHELKTQLAAEVLKRDLTGVVRQMTDMQQTVLGRIEASERKSIAFAEAAETRMQERFETWDSHQEMISETLQGLLHGVSDLNKKISKERS